MDSPKRSLRGLSGSADTLDHMNDGTTPRQDPQHGTGDTSRDDAFIGAGRRADDQYRSEQDREGGWTGFGAAKPDPDSPQQKPGRGFAFSRRAHESAPREADGTGAESGNEPTAVFPTYAQNRPQDPHWTPYGPSYPQYRPNPTPGSTATDPGGPFGPQTPPSAPTSRKRGRGAGIVAAAVLAGVLGGVGGAAGYSAVTDSPEAAAPATAETSSSSVSNVKAPAGSVAAVAQAILPSVVKVDVAGAAGSGSGSGIILTADGYIATNNHVVQLAENGGEIAVSFNDGSSAQATIVGTDPVTDLAVIKAKGVSGLEPANLGSSGSLQVGQPVVAVGSPFGLESTVTSGIVSALNRPVTAGGEGGGPGTTFPGIQTDAAINPGNSGGALVNMNGEVVGINSAIRSTQSLGGQAGSIGLGFAIPIDEAKPIIQQLKNGEQATHARLGVTVGTPENSEGLPAGAQVRTIVPGSAAAKAGLQQGDVITKVGDQPISTSDGLVAMVRAYRPGDQATLTVVRNGDSHQVKVTFGSDAGSNET